MFDKLKKPEDEKSNSKQKLRKANTTLQNNTTEKKLSVELKHNEPQLSDKTNVSSELKKLEEEWQQLLEEKTKPEKIEKSLKEKVIEEIKVKRQNITILKEQNSVLKEKCENLAKMLDIQIQK